MHRIVHPRSSGCQPPAVTSAVSMKSKMSQEQRIEKQGVREPAQAPSPAAEPKQSREEASDKDARGKRNPRQSCDSPDHRAQSPESPRRRIPKRRIGAVNRRSPHRVWLVYRRIDHLRIGRQNLDRALAILGLRCDCLLRGVLQVPRLLRPGAHGLNGVHHIRLLRQKRIAQVRGPANVMTENVQNIGKSDQCLNARIPVLLLSGVDPLSCRQIPVLLQPLLRVDDFERIVVLAARTSLK